MSAEEFAREVKLSILSMELKGAKEALALVSGNSEKDKEEFQRWANYIKLLENNIFEIEVLGRAVQ